MYRNGGKFSLNEKNMKFFFLKNEALIYKM